VGGGGGSPCGGDVAEDQTLLEGDYANGLIDDTMSSLYITGLAWDPAAGAPPAPRWALADDARGLHGLLGAIARLEQLDLLTQVYQILAALVRGAVHTVMFVCCESDCEGLARGSDRA
jgi:hypothetical protein